MRGSPCGCKESDTTECLNLTESTQINFQSRKKSDQNLTDPTAVAQELGSHWLQWWNPEAKQG